MTNTSYNSRKFKRGLLVLLGLMTIGCANVSYPVEQIEQARLGQLVTDDPEIVEHVAKIAELEQLLLTLGPGVDPTEAADIAGSTVQYSLELADEYKLTAQPVIHNILVNYGRRPRGLCIHFAEDILRMLLDKNLKTFDVYWGVAYPTRPFRLEHSSAVVTAKNKSFESGILLDGWRDSGKIYFGPVTEDKRYNWELFDDKVTQEYREKKKTQQSNSVSAE